MLVPSVGEISLYLGQQTTDLDCSIIWGSVGCKIEFFKPNLAL